MKKLFLTLILVIVTISFSNSYSQITGSITAKGTVLTPISVSSTRDLDFGTDILPGVDKSVNINAATSGKFSLTGQASKQINISLTLPTNLLKGVVTMPITFSATDAGTKTTTGTMTTFNPASGTTASFGTDGKLDVFIGGTVDPSHTQAAGAYTGTISISLYYTGS